jgi:hypothetical protein
VGVAGVVSGAGDYGGVDFAVAGVDGGVRQGEERIFFFGKKKQKTFSWCFARSLAIARATRPESVFWLFSSEKNCLLPYAMSGASHAS